MAVFYLSDSLPRFRCPVITIGTFDGVHCGHKSILKAVADQSKDAGGESIVITFEPHPRKLLFPHLPLQLITPLAQKLELIIAAGIDHVVVVPFTKSFAALSARDYIAEFLVQRFQPEMIIIGYDHHFGHDRTGNIALLRQMQTVFGYAVREIPARMIEQAAVSSTKIRVALQEGRVGDASQMLGRKYTLRGTVIRGARLGRTLGYPTANLQPAGSDQLIPSTGIYAVWVKLHEKVFGGMLSIGFNPTVSDGKELHIEVHILDFHESVYGEELEVHFVQWLRNEVHFPSLEALKDQLQEDERHARSILLS